MSMKEGMGQQNIIEAKRQEPRNGGTTETAEVETGYHSENGEHAEAVAFVEKHRDFFEHYAKGKVNIKPAPASIKTFAFNLENNDIYINSMFYKKRGLSEEKTVFATLHEIEHFAEKKQLLLEPQKKGKGGRVIEESGEKKFAGYLKRIKESRAFGLMDNCVADIRENKTVVSKTNKGMGELEQKVYREDLFNETDFTKQPRHIQFCQTILREARVPGEKCLVDPDVRLALDEVANTKGLLDIMTNPATPMSMRLRLQERYIWPKVEALLEKDKEDKKKQKEQEKKDKQKSEGEKGEKGKPENEESKPGDGGEESDKIEETDPNKIFAKEYEEAEKKFPEAVPIEDVEKALKEWQEAQKGNKDGGEKADQEYADKLGVEKKDLQEYRKIVESLENMVNPETDVSLMEELKNLFSRIISKRTKLQQAPKYPVEEGDELSDPAQLVADVKSGNLQPKVWENTEIIEKKGDRFGEVEITLVCDRSGSMDEGQKAVEQRKSAVLVMEVLKEFADMCEEEKINIDKPLEVKSEVYTFAGSSEDKTPLKKMSKELGEAERISVLKKLHDLPGSTTDFNCLEAVAENLDDDTKKKILEGELKKIVIVFTDGGSDKPDRVQSALKVLRDSGVIVIGVGMTEAGRPVIETYAPNALVVEDVTKLPIVLGDLLKEHLKDL